MIQITQFKIDDTRTCWKVQWSDAAGEHTEKFLWFPDASEFVTKELL